MMRSIKGFDTKPELIVRSALHKRGFRFRLHVSSLPGRPDIVLHKYNVVINVNGCFWHRHPGCKYATTPATNVETWRQKFDANVERDKRNQQLLLASGWRTGVVWECSLKNRTLLDLNLLFDEVAEWLKLGHGSLKVFG